MVSGIQLPSNVITKRLLKNGVTQNKTISEPFQFHNSFPRGVTIPFFSFTCNGKRQDDNMRRKTITKLHTHEKSLV